MDLFFLLFAIALLLFLFYTAIGEKFANVFIRLLVFAFVNALGLALALAIVGMPFFTIHAVHYFLAIFGWQRIFDLILKGIRQNETKI